MIFFQSTVAKLRQPRYFKFPSGFCVTQNPKHWSSEIESLDEIISPYVTKKLPVDQKALLVWDVFRGQMTGKVKERLDELNIECVYVPANMTHFFQPLDLTVNGCAKQRMRKELLHIIRVLLSNS